MTRYCQLASGSKGNATLVETNQVRLLIDAGISAKALAERLVELDVTLDTIDAILVSHEHSDHIRSVGTLAKRYGIPILANAETAKALCTTLNHMPRFKIFTTGERFTFGGLEIHPFSVPHDAMDPVAFTLTMESVKLGVCTDLGFATTLVRGALKDCTHLILEANHQPEMVHASMRPSHLKQRILGRSGHLSNQAAANLLQELHHSNLYHVSLSHLSEECNCPEKARQVVEPILANTQLTVAPQHQRNVCVCVD